VTLPAVILELLAQLFLFVRRLTRTPSNDKNVEEFGCIDYSAKVYDGTGGNVNKVTAVFHIDILKWLGYNFRLQLMFKG